MLHIVKNETKLELALQYCSVNDDILLIEDASYISNPNAMNFELIKECSALYVLSEDLIARGIARFTASHIIPIDFMGFVDLTIKHQKSITW